MQFSRPSSCLDVGFGARLRPVRVGLAALVLLVGCATPSAEAPEPPTRAPIVPLGEAGSEPLAFRRVVYRIPANAVIGEARVGRRSKEEVRWNSLRRASLSYNVAITDGLRARGYDVRDEADALFDPTDGAKVRYEMAAILHEASVDYKYAFDAKRESAGQGVGRMQVEVEVRLHDAIEKRTVYSRRFTGEGRDEGFKPNPLIPAVVNAVLEATTDAEFVAVLARVDSDRSAGAGDASNRLAACPTRATQALPDDLPLTLEAVVEILAGGVSGSGTIVSHDGWVVTAAHVVTDAPEVWVRLRSGVQLPATLVEANTERDLALLQIPGRDHPCAPLRTAAGGLDLGSDVFAVNVAIGDDREATVTRGVVSGFPMRDGRRFIQTDASLNPGSSGGPLLAPDGSIAGITVRKVVDVGVEGVGLAVPVNEAIDGLSIDVGSDESTP